MPLDLRFVTVDLLWRDDNVQRTGSLNRAFPGTEVACRPRIQGFWVQLSMVGVNGPGDGAAEAYLTMGALSLGPDSPDSGEAILGKCDAAWVDLATEESPTEE